jgi:hypothetical protein
MENEQIPDVSDPDIRQMVLDTHGSYELRDKFRLVAVVCGVCAKDWPCPSIKAARATRSVRAVG